MATYSCELTGDDVSKIQIATSRNVTRKHSMKAINACLMLMAFLFALVGFSYLAFDPIVKHVILSKLVLRNTSDFAEIWERPPITPHLKVYFFNLTNAEQFFNGTERPIVREVGPYTYHQQWIKENVHWHNNGTMSYSTRKIYTFIPEKSVGDHSTDKITTLNVPVISAFYQMRDSGFWTQWGLQELVSSYDYKQWITKSAEELVWGYDEPLFELAKMVMPDPPSYTKFGFFADKNNSDNLATYTMFTGEGDPYKLSRISLFNGNEHLDFWKTDECNVVKGSDGAAFNPYIQRKDTLWFFNDQLCRSYPLTYEKDVISKTLPGFRFVPRTDVFKSPKSVPENDCFCTDDDLCSMLGDGMFGVSACQFNAPIVLSWPHFLHANRSYVEAVKGMRPDHDSHSFYFDVQPTTGSTLSAKARIQINLAVKNIPGFDMMSKVEDSIVPSLWFEEGLDELGDELVEVISGAVISPPMWKNYIFCLLLGLISSTTVIGLVALVRLALNKKSDRSSKRASLNLRDACKELLDQHNMDKMIQDPTTQPMLQSTDASTESSRLTTANHSRNTSTGSNQVVGNDNAERLRLILDEPKNHHIVKNHQNRLPTV